MRRFGVLVAALAALVAALAVLPASAAASPKQESMFQDDNLIVYNSPIGMTRTLARLKALGVDRVRVSVFWKLVAPAGSSNTRPAFDATDPAAYPAGAWNRYDNIVRVARAIGLAVNFNVTSPAPNWATGNPERKDIDETYNPNAGEFALFVRALGKRYSGVYAPDPAAPPLPRVDYWSIWNEPNQAGWLTPQWVDDPHGSKTMIEAAPHIYRALVDAAWAALFVTGHGVDTILVGETAPKGLLDLQGTTRSIDSLRFIRQLYCLDDNLQFLQGQAAEVRGCPTSDQPSTFPQQHPALFHMSGYAHHPYELTFAPNRPPPHPDRWVTIGNLSSLGRTLVKIFHRYGQPVPGGRHRVPLYLTEFGYQTNPPDPFGVRPARQAAYLNQAEYIAYRNSSVRALTQFLLVDDKPVAGYPRDSTGAWSTFQSGLIGLDGHHKPAFDAYQLPVWVARSRLRRGQTTRVWGLVRLAPNGAPQPVQVQVRGARSRRGFRKLKTVMTAPGPGYLQTRVRLRRSSLLRLAWQGPNGRMHYSRPVAVSVGRKVRR
jgi:hypothetical protein